MKTTKNRATFRAILAGLWGRPTTMNGRSWRALGLALLAALLVVVGTAFALSTVEWRVISGGGGISSGGSAVVNSTFGQPITGSSGGGNVALEAGYWGGMGAYEVTVHELNTAVLGTGAGSISSNPSGIDCGVDCSESFAYGTAVTLTATYDTNTTAVNWGGACTTAVGDSCVVTITETKNVTTTFTLGNFALGIIMDGSGSVTSDPLGIDCQEGGGTCNAVFTATQTVTLTAVPDADYKFTGWSGGGCSGTDSCVVTMTESMAVTAVFELDEYLVYLPMVIKP